MNTKKRTHCPGCGSRAKPVRTVTLRSLLKDEVAAPTNQADPQSCCPSSGSTAGGCLPAQADTGWRFCDSPGCDIVYFSEHDDTTFTKSQLRVEVGIKETDGERPLCYCFGHSVESMKQELQAHGTCSALEDIRAKMKAPGCRCETENPSGSCCLGSVAKGLKIAQHELGMNAHNDAPPPGAGTVAPNGPTTGRGEKIAVAGTLVSAVMASACCWLPLVLLAVGVSGAGIAATLETYRPHFMVLTFGFLAAAFCFTWRPKKAASGSSGDCCEPRPAAHGCCADDPVTTADCCTPKAGRPFSIMTLNKVMLWGVTVLAIAFLFFPGYVGAFLGGGGTDGSTVTQDMNRAVLAVDGMTCAGCAAGIAAAVRDVPGILAVEVDFAAGVMVVGTEFCCPIPEKEILAAVRSAGFHGRVTRNIPAGTADRLQADR